MGKAMENFVHQQNIERFEAFLATAKDETERQRIQALIDEEEKRHASALRAHLGMLPNERLSSVNLIN